jgi:hypothetical protein
MMEKIPEEFEEKLEAYFEAYQEDLIDRIERLMVPLRDGVRTLLTRLDGTKRIEDKLEDLAYDMDVNITEATENATSSLSETLEDIRATAHEILEQGDGF